MSEITSPNVCGVRSSIERMTGRAGRPFVILLVAILSFAGCFSVGPDYKAPEIVAPVEWSRNLRGGLSAAEPEAQTLAKWWTTLGDMDLSNLMERAIAGNSDLKKAQARIREARVRRGVAEAGLFPSLNVAGS
ncbi:MAG TPA: TolC family protein, partial [Candidatus Binatia bacterium]|nr:TolC family protein [Candidatus Binatia bacterium]